MNVASQIFEARIDNDMLDKAESYLAAGEDLGSVAPPSIRRLPAGPGRCRKPTSSSCKHHWKRGGGGGRRQALPELFPKNTPAALDPLPENLKPSDMQKRFSPAQIILIVACFDGAYDISLHDDRQLENALVTNLLERLD